MGLINYFFGKSKQILTEADNNELRELQRQAYLIEARKLVEQQGIERARKELGPKPKKEGSIF
jgi:uncharacterized protein YnzC (UPF0291/DUF896 family)